MYILIGAGVLVVIAGVYIFTTLSRFAESSGALEQISRELLTRLQKIEMRLEETEARVNDNFAAMRKEQRESASEARSEQTRGISAFGEIQASRLKEIGVLQRDNFKNFSEQLTGVSRLNEEKLEAIRSVVEEKLLELIKGNEEKLEKMRATVDEKLHETLEKRLGEAFSSVSERLEEVHKGLGEMRALTTDVGDLKKVLSNVKVRGTWGEMQLGAMLEQILSKEQYAENIATRPNCRERVEFAVILPGTGGGRVLLPLDSNFPLEDYRALVSASDDGNKEETAQRRDSLSKRVLSEAKDIHDKYIEPPYTTDFAILYLPIEGLYAEVLRMDGLCERLSREFRVVPAGPATICALLNSLRMGFRTLAIEKRSSEVWELLGKVKSEFDKFGVMIEKTRKKIDEAARELDNADKRTRGINRVLKDVERLPLSGEEEFVQAEALEEE